MALPLEERLKNLEVQFRQLQAQNYYGHPSENKVFHGVIRTVDNFLSDTTNECDAWLTVCPFEPFTPSDFGDLNFIDTNEHPLKRTNTNTRSVNVYVVNVPVDLIKLFFRPGQVVKFWQYSGDGALADKVRGTFVTILEKWEFTARIDWDNDADSGRGMYRFTGVYWDPNTTTNAEEKWVKLTLCDDGDTFYTGHAINLDVVGGNFPRSPKKATPFYAKVTRETNPIWHGDNCQLDDPSGLCFQYYFSSDVIIHWGVIADVGNCGASITVNPSDENGNLLSPVTVTLATFAGCNTTFKGICADVGNIVPYILTGEATGTLINPYKRWSAWYTCGTNTSVVPDVREVKFSRYYFVLDTLTESDCETADPSILTVDWRGMRVTGYSNDHKDDIKEISFDGITPPTGDPSEHWAQLAFKVASEDATRTISGNTCPEETHKSAKVTGWVKLKKLTLLDSDCQPVDVFVPDTGS